MEAKIVTFRQSESERKEMKKALLMVFFLVAVLMAGPAEKSKKLTIIFTNDIHGGITETRAEFLNPEYPPVLGGGAAAYRLIRIAREKAAKEDGMVIVSDAGDIFQGSVLGTRSRGKAMIRYFNYIGLDYSVPGNHDFDLGKETLDSLIRDSRFSWIACNIIDTRTGELWEPLKPYIVKEFHGVRIGITGIATGATKNMAFSENIQYLDFLPEIPSLQKTVDEMRQNGVDIVIAVVHTGLPYDVKEGMQRLESLTYEEVKDRIGVGAMEIARFVHGIDILFGGHIHVGYDKPYEDPVTHTLCFQNYGNGGNLGWVDILIDPEHKMITGYETPLLNSTLMLLTMDSYPVDPELYQLIREEQEKYEAGFHRVIGETRVALTRTPAGESLLGNVVCDAMIEATGADFAFTNYGGLRDDIKMGMITYKDLFEVLPFGNQLVVFKAKGAFLKRIIEERVKGNNRGILIGGGKVVIDRSRPDGNRVVSMEIGGEKLDEEKIYTVVTSDYLMEGNSGLKLLLEVSEENKTYPGKYMLDALVEYVQRHSPLKVQTDGRWVMVK